MRETPSPRMDFFIGKGKAVFPRHLRALVEARLELRDASGRRQAIGCAADWPSVGWLDKRPDIAPEAKLVQLLDLVRFAADTYAAGGETFESPFARWHDGYRLVMEQGRTRGLVDLSASFASSLIERALIDAVCRLKGCSFLKALEGDLLQIRPGDVHQELQGIEGYRLPETVHHTIAIRHTVGLADPITDGDLDAADRVNDGQPETLEEYIRHDGLTHFKIKVSGDCDEALDKLQRIWAVLVSQGIEQPFITLDCNEAYADINALDAFVRLFEQRLPEMFPRVALIEQPLPRTLATENLTAADVDILRAINARKPLIIDEGDGTLESFVNARKIGFSGVSHKNCKGVIKSLLNRQLCDHFAASGTPSLMSAEDLTHMPVVSLNQDFAVVAALGLDNAERNAHHYFLGLSHLTDDEKRAALDQYPDVYRREQDEVFLNIRDGKVNCAQILTSAGFGASDTPDWSVMTKMNEWNDALRESVG